MLQFKSQPQNNRDHSGLFAPIFLKRTGKLYAALVFLLQLLTYLPDDQFSDLQVRCSSHSTPRVAENGDPNRWPASGWLGKRMIHVVNKR